MFSEENTVLEHSLKLERWHDPPHISKVKQCEILIKILPQKYTVHLSKL